MGLLGRLLVREANRLVRNMAEDALEGEIRRQMNSSQQNNQAQQYNSYQQNNNQQYDYTQSSAPSGFSWGPVMPAEENQFSWNGSYVDYFAHIFRDDFPQFQLQIETPPGRSATVMTLHYGGRIALIVELLSEKSSAKKLRNQCRINGIPYLRFYYDHDGWWNTRRYVVTRVRSALGM